MLPALAAAVAAAGCAPRPTPDAGRAPLAAGAGRAVAERAAGTCDAAAAQRFVGRPGSDAILGAARKAARADRLRRIRPGAAATMDYRTDRLTATLDAGGVVRVLRCG